MTSLVIWGAGGHAIVVADIVRLRGEFQIAGFLDDTRPESKGVAFCGATILGGGDVLGFLHNEGLEHVIVAVGDCSARLRLAAEANRFGLAFATALHPHAVIAGGVRVGAGTVAAAGAIVNPEARIGDHVILNTGCSVDHECVVGDGAHIGPGCRLGGRVHVGRGVHIGIGATITDRVRIGSRSIIGAGALVLDDVPEGVVCYGAPARVIREIDR